MIPVCVRVYERVSLSTVSIPQLFCQCFAFRLYNLVQAHEIVEMLSLPVLGMQVSTRHVSCIEELHDSRSRESNHGDVISTLLWLPIPMHVPCQL